MKSIRILRVTRRDGHDARLATERTLWRAGVSLTEQLREERDKIRLADEAAERQDALNRERVRRYDEARYAKKRGGAQ